MCDLSPKLAPKSNIRLSLIKNFLWNSISLWIQSIKFGFLYFRIKKWSFEYLKKKISFLKKKFPLTIGYSDHTLGINAAIAAIVLGAKIIEKHFTLDNNYSRFRDHQLSLNPGNMKYLVESIRSIESMMGKEQKIVQPSEKKNIFSMRRSLYLSKDIDQNSKINFNDVSIVRPFAYLEPIDLNKVVGKAAKVDLDINAPIMLRNLKNWKF